MPQDWQPTPGDRQYAQKLEGRWFCDAQIDEMVLEFVEYFTTDPKGSKAKRPGWSMSWKRWCRHTTPWPEWQKAAVERDREQNRKQAEADQLAMGLEQASQERARPKLKPKIKHMPYPPRRLTESERQKMIQDMRESESPVSRPPRPRLGPRHVPMPAHLRGKIITPADKREGEG